MIKLRVLYIPIILLMLAITACNDHHDTPPNAHAEKTALIIDTDVGLDDVRAIMALLADSTLNIQGILTVEGSASLGKATDNLIGLLEENQITSIPVVKGISHPDLTPPSWRDQANNLAGSNFPPPRILSVYRFSEDVVDELTHHSNNISYLALGPLSNLAMINREYPDALRHIKQILIPVKIVENRIDAWNLIYDVESTQQVFKTVQTIELIDISGIEQQDITDEFSSLTGNTYSVQWIRSTLKNDSHAAKQLFLYDEIISAAVINPDLFETNNQKYFCRLNEENSFDLIPNSDGNIRIWRVKDHPGIFALLKHQWQNPPLEASPKSQHPSVPVRDLLRSFHGHLGPYVVLGYRMGNMALKELKSDGHFGLSVEVHSILSPPFSCLIDGVQLGSGCTLGKRNIQIHSYEGAGWARFTKKNGEVRIIRLRPEIPELVKKYVDERGVEEVGEALLAMTLAELFIIEQVAHHE